MSEISSRQLRTLRRQIRKLYGRNYIPLTAATSTISMGDVLKRKNNIFPELDGSLLGLGADDIQTGRKVNRNFMTESSVDISFKAAGQASTEVDIAQAKAGFEVKFSSKTAMFLKVLGLHEQTIKDFEALREAALRRYVQGGSGRVYLVRGLLVADRFYLQFGGSSGGSVGIELEGEGDVSAADVKVNAGFSVAWTKSVGFDIDAPNGGPLGYRVSAVRFRRLRRPRRVTDALLSGATEAEAVDELPVSEREALHASGDLEVVDCTDELACDIEDQD